MRNVNFIEGVKSAAWDLTTLELSMSLVTIKLELEKEVESEIQISLALIGSMKDNLKKSENQ